MGELFVKSKNQSSRQRAQAIYAELLRVSAEAQRNQIKLEKALKQTRIQAV
jgi:hypothetical protein